MMLASMCLQGMQQTVANWYSVSTIIIQTSCVTPLSKNVKPRFSRALFIRMDKPNNTYLDGT